MRRTSGLFRLSAGRDAGGAYASPATELFLINGVDRIEEWQPVRLELRGGELTDYLANDRGLRLCSARLREILEREAGPRDTLQWLEAEVKQGSVIAPYFVLHLPDPPDVLDPDHTVFVEGTTIVVKPVFSDSRIRPHRVFTYSDAGSFIWFVAPAVKQAIISSGINGVEFYRAPVV